ncbi:MAG: glutamate formimidoyltransferase, partial [Acidobacteria bacterium]
QVSMNLTNYEGTPIFRAFEMVEREAARYGARAVSSEIVGLVPQKALDACAEYYLQLEDFSAQQILENRLAAAGALTRGHGAGCDDLLDSVAAATAAPGGGSAAALGGALAAALGEMVSGLTAANKKFGAIEPRMRELAGRLGAARGLLRRLVDDDARAYSEVISARRLPKAATRRATAVPLETARAAAGALELLAELTERGNPNLRSDAATGSQLAFAALKGAQYNVLVNLPALSDAAFAAACRAEAAALVGRGSEALGRVDALLTG